MTSFSRVLAIGAHPDDVEYGCLGFLLKMSAHSKSHIYVASSGSSGDPSSGLNRIQESRMALKCLPESHLTLREAKGIHAADFLSAGHDLLAPL